jgi:lactoylglutathione lyase
MTATPQTQPNVQQVVPFFTVADMRASLKFYVDGLGFTMTQKWESDGKVRWCALALGRAALMLQERSASRTPPGQVGTDVISYFICQDALAIYRDVTGRGVQAPQEPVVANGMWLFLLNDPDGYRIAFESRTSVREGTTMSEHEWSQS